MSYATRLFSFQRGYCTVLNKRFLPIVLLTTVLAVVALAGYLLPEDADTAEPVRIAMKNAGGPVVFEHSKHVEWTDSCQSCHHDMLSGAKEPMACNDCHGLVMTEDFTAAHQQTFSADSCAVCHHYQPGKQDWGHAAHAEDFGIDCVTCHHADTDIEPEPSNCADCHEAGAAPSKNAFEAGVPPTLADAVHNKCASCHGDWFDLKARGCSKCHFDAVPEGREKKERLHTNMETMTCKACHEQAPDKLIPGRMQAHHASCMGCHSEVGAGPRTQQDCRQCHM